MKPHTENDVRQEAPLSRSQPPQLRPALPSFRRRWAQAVAMWQAAASNRFKAVKTNPSSTLRAFWFGLLLVCCSLPLRAEQIGLLTYEVVNGSTVTITDYAPDLDPRRHLQASLPAPVVSETTLSLNFHATAPGLTYRAETSNDLTNWTTTGVTQSAPAPDGRSTATIPPDAPHRFLRLTVED